MLGMYVGSQGLTQYTPAPQNTPGPDAPDPMCWERTEYLVHMGNLGRYLPDIFLEGI